MHVHPIPAAAAAADLAGLHVLDPRGVMRAADVPGMCDRGQCFELAGDGARAVYVVRVLGDVAWIDAAHGSGPAGVDLVAAIDAAVCAQASGLRRVALQTARPGMVRKLRRLGYAVNGWIMGKALT